MAREVIFLKFIIKIIFKGMENEKNVEREFLFSFAKINKYFIIPFLCPIFCMIANYFILLIFKTEHIKNKEFLLINISCAHI